MISHNGKTIARTLGTDHDPCKGEPWQARAACVGHDPELWYPTGTSGTLGVPANYGPARAICAVCPVRAECIEDAIANRDAWGVRGGLSPDQLAGIMDTLADGAA